MELAFTFGHHITKRLPKKSTDALDRKRVFLIYYPNTRTQGQVSTVGSAAHS